MHRSFRIMSEYLFLQLVKNRVIRLTVWIVYRDCEHVFNLNFNPSPIGHTVNKNLKLQKIKQNNQTGTF